MTKKLLLVLALVACTNDTDKVRRLLERDGYTEVQVGGYAFFGCGRDDAFSNSFTAMKKGARVSGYVCGGWMKGMTVRVDE